MVEVDVYSVLNGNWTILVTIFFSLFQSKYLRDLETFLRAESCSIVDINDYRNVNKYANVYSILVTKN